ncbi:hypothetical protein KUF83_29955 [Streptomyces sp. BV286]|uniref:hypothetical protein n=1 Tax=Streptomyces sp. BV286 TaxID=2849672 RepID=UPI001C2E6943|nr:hypothetical protein [Streptomyces sp. BV286]MBV1940760.1 hypothetical protein [Streptomyces sp. BV286]
MPPRTRKNEADPEGQIPDTVETTAAEAAEDKAVPAHTETKTPIVAPLEPPAESLPDPVPEPVLLTTAQQLLPATALGDIVDEATGEHPADPNTVFVPVDQYGNVHRCTARLVEHVGMGAYNTPATRLLVPVDAQLKRHQMERVVNRLRAQLDAAAE